MGGHLVQLPIADGADKRLDLLVAWGGAAAGSGARLTEPAVDGAAQRDVRDMALRGAVQAHNRRDKEWIGTLIVDDSEENRKK